MEDQQFVQTRPPRAKGRTHGITWWVGRWPVLLHRWHLGRLLGTQYVIIQHRGRRSGSSYETAVMTLKHDARTGEVVVVAPSRRSDWYRNIRASQPIGVYVGNIAYEREPRFLEPAETAAALEWSRINRRRNARVQAWFFHWPWPGDAGQLEALARSLRGVAFRPHLPERAAEAAEKVHSAPLLSGRQQPNRSDAGPLGQKLRRLGLAGPIEYVFQILHGFTRPRLLTSGATNQEKELPLPGDDLVPDATSVRTRAGTVAVPPDLVWPWIAQLGAGRGGWPSWYPFTRPHDSSPTQLIPGGQRIEVGDVLLEVEGPESSAQWRVDAVQPGAHLVLHSCRTLDTGTEVTRSGSRRWADISWAFVLRPAPGHTTRLVIRTRSAISPRWYGWLARPLLVGDTVMQRELIAAIARRAEGRLAPSHPR